MVTEAQTEAKIDSVLTKYQTTEIQYYPYTSGPTDVYGQRDVTFGTPVTAVGRAIIEPTEEVITDIGRIVDIDVAFLFSRLEMLRKFPTAVEGAWMDDAGQLSWNGSRYRIVRTAPSGQIATKFLLFILLAKDLD